MSLMNTTTTKTNNLIVAESRSEEDSCQAGTPGCCVDHNACEHRCETW